MKKPTDRSVGKYINKMYASYGHFKGVNICRNTASEDRLPSWWA